MKTVTFDEQIWKLVPKEPTKEMLEAGTIPKGLTMDGYPTQHSIRDKYIAMLHAAPECKEE